MFVCVCILIKTFDQSIDCVSFVFGKEREAKRKKLSSYIEKEKQSRYNSIVNEKK